MITPSNNLQGKKLAESIGLETKNLRSFTLQVQPDDVITVEASYYVMEKDLQGFKEAIKKFTLQPNGD